MLTIFSIPKPFIGHTGVIQRNAIQSWTILGSNVEIVLLGDDQGVKEVANEFRIHHIPNIQKNEFGTPIISSAFQLAAQFSSKNYLCYVNSDIIIFQSLIEALDLVNFKQFLMIGQRWNLDLTDPIDFSDDQWEKTIASVVSDRGILQPPFGSDYFLYPKVIDWNMPEFAVGRPGWDNWLIYQARSRQVPVIDATNAAIVVHQNHDYAHIPEGKDKISFEGPEAIANRSLVNDDCNSFGANDSTHNISDNRLRKACKYYYLRHRVPHQKALNPKAGIFTRFSWKVMQSIIYRRWLFPNSLLENLIYSFTE